MNFQKISQIVLRTESSWYEFKVSSYLNFCGINGSCYDHEIYTDN